MNTETIQKAAARIKGEYVLIGTAALWLRGYDVDPHDIDFLVADPQTHIGHFDEREPASTPGSIKAVEDGVPVDYVFADEVRRQFLERSAEVVDGVMVASIDTVLAIKRFASRAKDSEFLRRWTRGLVRQRAA